MRKESAYIGLGSNLGDSRGLLGAASDLIARLEGTRILASSSIFFTEPQEDREQPWFLNQALHIETSLAPYALLASLLKIELQLGRRRGERRFGPRPVDLDILLYGRLSLEEAELCIPHPRLERRAFALLPLLEITPDLTLPDGRTAAELLSGLEFRLEGDKILQS
jgi:2-amino-4-hydroxy-6-hydroxymethyldihydropteridine diphosphokinase